MSIFLDDESKCQYLLWFWLIWDYLYSSSSPSDSIDVIKCEIFTL